MTEDDRDERADDDAADHDGWPITVIPLPGSATPIAVEDANPSSEREDEADEHTEHRPEDADHEALEAQRPLDLLRRRADRRQHRELAQPLGDDHAEGVVDHEAADEQREQREALQRRLQDLAEARRPRLACRRGSRRRSAP